MYLYILKVLTMAMTMIEKILAGHSGKTSVKPGDIVDVIIDARVARDFGGANVVKNIREHDLGIEDPKKTFLTFDCNPTGSDQKYAANQHLCRLFAREQGIKVYDIDKGIGTHILIEEGLAYPGSTAVSTDSHANILGAVGAFGQGMGDKDIAAAWGHGKVWFKVPPSAKIHFKGSKPAQVTAKDFILNMLASFGANTLLGLSIELYGDVIDTMSLDERITISSMATEMGAIIILFPPNQEVLQFCESRLKKKINPVFADEDAVYDRVEEMDVTTFTKRVSMPGKPHDAVSLPEEKVWIDSAFIGSCTNGRIKDIAAAACIMKGRSVAPGVVLKIVPATDKVWEKALEEGYIEMLKEAGALISNAGCAGCAAGQVGQNGPGEVTISTGNRNFPGKQGQGEVYLASPEVVAASAIAGYIVAPENIPEQHVMRPLSTSTRDNNTGKIEKDERQRQVEFEGRVWVIPENDIDTDMIYHNRYLTVTKQEEMGQYTFDNLKGYENFAREAKQGDIIITAKNFGAGSSRQQAVDCFKSLGVSAIIAESFGAIYERNAINAAFPILSSDALDKLNIVTGEKIHVNLKTGSIRNISKDISVEGHPFSDVQLDIYNKNGLF